MPTYTEDFLNEKNKRQNIPIVLAIVEISPAFIGNVTSNSKTTAVLETGLTTVINRYLSDNAQSLLDIYGNSKWVVSFESGMNIGSKRFVTSFSGNTIGFTPTLDNVPYSSSESLYDKVRISKCLFLAAWNMPIDFYLPDDSAGVGQAMEYAPFPMRIEPIGTNLTGEVMNMQMAVSNVNRLIGNYVQIENGLQGNRVIRLVVFDGLLDNKHNCKRDTMYIDKVTIEDKVVSVTLESKFNVVGIDLPLGVYNRDFCCWRYKSRECAFGWPQTLVPGAPNSAGNLNLTKYGLLQDGKLKFPLADLTRCDHTLNGYNGCTAHLNTSRFGAFPGIPITR
jgi:phage-related protein